MRFNFIFSIPILLLISPALAETKESAFTNDEAVSNKGKKQYVIETGLLVGYGSKEFSESGPNPFNVNFGISVGTVVNSSVYLGSSFIYYVGQSGPNGTNGTTGETGSWRTSTLTATIDAGYKFQFEKLGNLAVRPYVAVGLLERMVSIAGSSSGIHRLLIAPSIALQFPIGSSGFLGLDFRLGLQLFNSEALTNLTTSANVGYNF